MSARGVIGGAATGAGIGSAFGPVGLGIGAGLGALFGLLGGGRQDKPASPEAEALLLWELQRQQRLNPLMERVLTLSFSRLPEWTRQGLAIPSFAQVEGRRRPDDSRDDFAQSPTMRALLQLQRHRMLMADPLIQAIERLAMRRLPSGRTRADVELERSFRPPRVGPIVDPSPRPPWQFPPRHPQFPLLPGPTKPIRPPLPGPPRPPRIR